MALLVPVFEFCVLGMSMCFKASVKPRRVILRGLVLAAMGSVAAGCSSDAMRFTDRMYTAAVPASAQQAKVVNVVPQQAYPSQLPTVPNVDYTTTASVQRRAVTNDFMQSLRPRPIGLVGAVNRLASAPVAVAQQLAPQPALPSVVQPVYAIPQVQAVQTRPLLPSVNTPTVRQPTISASLPSVPAVPTLPNILPQTFPAAPQSAVVPIAVAAPVPTLAPAKSNQLLPSTVDMQTTGSIARTAQAMTPSVAPSLPQSMPVAQSAPQMQSGWSTRNASRVTLKSGETVYNLARRFGVPAKAIYAANGLENNAPVQAGQALIIPVYQYGSDAPISAPDANPETKLARSTAGSVLDLPERDAPQPMPRPHYQMAVLPQVPQLRERKAVETPAIAAAPVAPQMPSSNGVYRVVSGDSLYGVARKHNVTVSSLKAANGLPDGNLKIGQMLRIPAEGETVAVINQPVVTPNVTTQKQEAINVDPVITNTARSTPKATSSVEKVTEQTASVKAPETSGVARLRMPVQGRVVTAFKARENGRPNDGIDIAVPKGTSVRAAENGVVIYSGEGLSEYGRTVLIRHDDGLVTVYGHADELKVSRGDTVKRGQEIALSGMTGEASRPKLHFEVRKNTVPVDPNQYLN